MSFENSAGLGVYNQYGVRNTGGAVGVEHSKGSRKFLRLNLTGEMLNSGFLPPVKLPKGARFVGGYIRVDEVFVVTGTTPTIEIGSAGSTATNGIVITEAELEALGTKAVSSFVGTWATNSATGLTAAALVDIALEGDTAVSSAQGKAEVVLEYVDLAKV